MKAAEPSFNVGEFLGGARGAYEMILMAFEAGDMSKVPPFLAGEVYEGFAVAIEERTSKGLTIEANFVGLRELKLLEADFDTTSRRAEITVRFVGALGGGLPGFLYGVVEGNPREVKRQKDVWTVSRAMGSDNPTWQLVATGE